MQESPGATAGLPGVRSSRLRRDVKRHSRHPAVAAGGLFLIFAGILAMVQFSIPDLVGNDGYYHIRMAALMRADGLKPAFPWLPLTVLSPDRFVDHHFFFHVLLMPFAGGNLIAGAKWASVFFAALAFLAFWWVLRNGEVPYAGVWSLGLLIISSGFLYRMSMPRAQSLSLGILALSIYLIQKKSLRWLFVLAFLYVWTYNAFPLILVVAGAYAVARWLADGVLDVSPLGFATVGVAAGLLLNPYFPDNLRFLYHHLGPKLAEWQGVRVGNEWNPYNTVQLIEKTGPALVLFLSGPLALGLNPRRAHARTVWSLLLAIAFGALLFQSRRFVEYAPAFFLLFAALAWSPVIHTRQRRSSSQTSGWARRAIVTGLVVLMVLAGAITIRGALKSLTTSKPYSRYAQAATWLADHSPPGTRVFQTDWDDFPRLFYYNTENTYTVGLDPTYLLGHDAALYDRWVAITRGQVARPSARIQAEFGADYVFTDLRHRGFLEQARDDPGLLAVYRDPEAAIFQITRVSMVSPLSVEGNLGKLRRTISLRRGRDGRTSSERICPSWRILSE